MDSDLAHLMTKTYVEKRNPCTMMVSKDKRKTTRERRGRMYLGEYTRRRSGMEREPASKLRVVRVDCTKLRNRTEQDWGGKETKKQRFVGRRRMTHLYIVNE